MSKKLGLLQMELDALRKRREELRTLMAHAQTLENRIAGCESAIQKLRSLKPGEQKNESEPVPASFNEDDKAFWLDVNERYRELCQRHLEAL
jgi:prefoldin subunit 5